MSLTLAPAAITRRLRAAGLTGVRSSTISGGPLAGAVRVEVIEARQAVAVLLQAGYDAARSAQSEQVVLVTLPEPVVEGEVVPAGHAAPLAEQDAPLQPAAEPVPVPASTGLVERVAAALHERAPIVPASVSPFGEGRAVVTVSDRVIGDEGRYADAGSILGRQNSAAQALARAGFRTTTSGGSQVIVEDSHLGNDDLLDACGTVPAGLGLLLVPDSTPERLTCPRCRELLLGEEDAREVTAEQVADAILDRRPILDLYGRPAEFTPEQARTVDAGVTLATERLAARYGTTPEEVVRIGRDVIEETLAPVDEPGPEVDDPREEPRPLEYGEVPGPEVHTRSAGSRLSNAAVLSIAANGDPWTEQDPRVASADRRPPSLAPRDSRVRALRYR